MEKKDNLFIKNIIFFILFVLSFTNFNVLLSLPTPAVFSVTPSFGPQTGGTPVVIDGENFTGVTSVDFGITPAASFTFINANTINAVSPAGTGTVDVTVTTPLGTSLITPDDEFTYLASSPTVTSVSPNSGPTIGGTSVLITGTNFTGLTSAQFGSTPATSFNFISDTTINAVSPTGTGIVDIRVSTPGGTSPITPNDQFIYLNMPISTPIITSINPNGGPTTGGNIVTINGSGFNSANTLVFWI